MKSKSDCFFIVVKIVDRECKQIFRTNTIESTSRGFDDIVDAVQYYHKLRDTLHRENKID